MSKEKKKVVGTFRTEQGAQIFIKTMAYIGTMTKNGIGAFQAIKAAVQGLMIAMYYKYIIMIIYSYYHILR